MEVRGRTEIWAVVATLIENCKLSGVDPYAYLTDVLAKIVNGYPNSAIDDLLPWAYASSDTLKQVA
jgi:transposase